MWVGQVSLLLAYADRGELGDANLRFVIVCLGVIVAVGALAMLPVVLARRRGHRRGEAVTGMTVLWAVVLGGSIILNEMGRAKWAREQKVRIQSGYYDPQDESDAPVHPWGLWGGLAVGYGALMVWAMAGASEGQGSVR